MRALQPHCVTAGRSEGLPGVSTTARQGILLGVQLVRFIKRLTSSFRTPDCRQISPEAIKTKKHEACEGLRASEVVREAWIVSLQLHRQILELNRGGCSSALITPFFDYTSIRIAVKSKKILALFKVIKNP